MGVNPISGENEVIIQGKKYCLRFSWKALAEIEAKFGGNPDLFKTEVIAFVASVGMREKHPDMTIEKILELSPPLIPFAAEIQTTLHWAYFGKEPYKKADDQKEKKKTMTGFWKRLISRSGLG